MSPGDRTRPARVLVVGSLNADITVRTPRMPEAGETVSGGPVLVRPGGKSANQAVAAARLGASVELVGLVGDDPHGVLLREAATAAGVDTAGVTTRTGGVTGTAIVIVTGSGENCIVVSPGTNGEFEPSDVPAGSVAGAAVVCLALEVPVRTVAHVAALARRRGAEVVLNPSPYQDLPPDVLVAATLLVLNEPELAQMLRIGDVRDLGWPAVRDRLRARGVDRAVVTLGAAGAVVVDERGVTPVPGRAVRAVDTTGSGDAFVGALAAALAGGAELVAAAHRANAVGAYAATREGAQASYPDSVELEGWLRRGRTRGCGTGDG